MKKNIAKKKLKKKNIRKKTQNHWKFSKKKETH